MYQSIYFERIEEGKYELDIVSPQRVWSSDDPGRDFAKHCECDIRVPTQEELVNIFTQLSADIAMNNIMGDLMLKYYSYNLNDWTLYKSELPSLYEKEHSITNNTPGDLSRPHKIAMMMRCMNILVNGNPMKTLTANQYYMFDRYYRRIVRARLEESSQHPSAIIIRSICSKLGLKNTYDPSQFTDIARVDTETCIFCTQCKSITQWYNNAEEALGLVLRSWSGGELIKEQGGYRIRVPEAVKAMVPLLKNTEQFLTL